jgi:hypothetical protein
MQLRGKQKWIYRLIKESGFLGINTNQLRNITHAVDVPKLVSELNKKGVRIVSKREHDGTATYSLESQPEHRICTVWDPILQKEVSLSI